MPNEIRLIDANALMDALRDAEFSEIVPLDEVDSVIVDCPTLDYAPVNRWVSVKDRLPEDDSYYLAFTTEHTCEVYRYDGDGEWVTDCGDTANHDITHWQPLPEPPKEGE